MAIVEDEVRNDSEEENEIEVVVEEDDDGEQDSDDFDDDEDVDDLEQKVADLEQRISKDPYNYDDHIELIQALWALSELDRWRQAFDRLQELTLLKAEHWLLRLQTEETLAHSEESRNYITQLYEQATLDCYSIPILSAWCSWAVSAGAETARAQLDELLRRAGPDPLSGKLFWDAKLEFEKVQLESMSEQDPEYGAQRERVLWCLEEAVSRPLLRAEEALPQFEELALLLRDQVYLDKVKKQHEVATEYLLKISPFEDKLLTLENQEDKIKVYEEYINKVQELAEDEKYAECDSNGILKVLFERATTECLSAAGALQLLQRYARLTRRGSSRVTQRRVLAACARRAPTTHYFWTLQMQQAEHEEKDFEEVKSILESALAKGMSSCKEAEQLWLSYLEYCRRRTAFDSADAVERLRRTFRLAWDSLAESWGEEANDSEVPLFWARLEYKRMNDPKQGKEIFEEIFKYGENKTLSKYWEALVLLESSRSPPAAEHKLRELFRRALRFVADYPPAVARAWTDWERAYGQLDTARECADLCEKKLADWRDNYHAMKEKMTNTKHKGKQGQVNKAKFDKKKTDNRALVKGKRKYEESAKGGEAGKRKKEEQTAVEVREKDGDSGGGTKRPHGDDDEKQVTEGKRQRTESGSSGERGASAGAGPGPGAGVGAGREACTLFVSNLEFKVDENKLRDKLSEFGEIVSMRVKAGVKAFGGSICYCQYSAPESVEKALAHDRTPLEGRPMFLSRYAAGKGKPQPSFKYATTAEPNKLFVRNLPYSHCTRDALAELFAEHGALTDIRVVTFKDGKPKGLAYVEYSSAAEAAAALAATHGREVAGRRLDVALSAPPPRAAPAPAAPAPTLGLPKRDAGRGGTMRRTQLSSFIPSVLQRASTSKAAAAANGDDKKPLSNNDFRSMLLNK